MFEGVFPALITPFNADNRIDVASFRNIVEYVEKGGVAGMVACGTTGESATMSTQEHMELIDLTVDCANTTVIAGTGSNNTTEAVELTRHAYDAGANAVLIISPYYNKPNNAGLIAHFSSIARSADIPVILYNVPSRTGQDMPLEVITELSRIENIVGIKEASGNPVKVSRIIENTVDEDFMVISGEDGLTLPLMCMGAVGVISVVANVVPEKMTELVNAVKNNDLKKAQALHYELAPLTRALFSETNPIPVKKAMDMLGLANGRLRLPLAPLSREHETILEDVMRGLGCIS
ncbi:dihydrodipicolinate synthase [Methanomethylovorans hollandica DSM 15978]|uniref:4-hydroxy-tetrahydrodipicolinate synthase n=1 Tax=Methanomethylovorans hollandica (strain DSM 15978 / NBRC 107637 / DMS1) TaxID=867904 RepID=L0KV27_METHD|nr:4-hydroxy-tetrahydrodipicolinate synthase [Methanomethylovorans hollandica]AGB48555.1 dihydrodipicolinate synthase [Methanomethylovorans hollandica DSM 15978]